jgi:thioredoxin 1
MQESTMSQPYSVAQPQRSSIDAMEGIIALEFGADWCGHCRAAQAPIAAALKDVPDITHIKVEDGSGRALGRSLRVKLWPTLVFLRQGKELARVVRPLEAAEVEQALAAFKLP